MNLTKSHILIGFLIATSLSSVAQLINWNTGEDYSIKFSGKRVEGLFKELNAYILFDPSNPDSSKISGGVGVMSINTGNDLKNKHAKAKKALNAEHFPVIWFKSTKIIRSGNLFVATGNLTLKDITKEIQLPFTFEQTSTGAIFRGKFFINPRDYHVKKMGTPAKIEIELTVPVTR